jgi:hypothetical protein
LQARRDVDRIADDIVGGRLDDDLARVDGDPEPEVPGGRALLAGEPAEGLLHGERRAHGAHRVVLGHPRQPERGHDAVAEQLDDRAAVGLDRRVQRPVVPPHEAPHRLRVEPLVQRRRADQVGEDDRDDLARDRVIGGRGETSDQRGAAAAAELRRGSRGAPARRTALLEACPAFLAERRAERILVLAR